MTPPRMQTLSITAQEFGQFQAWIYGKAGIRLSEEKWALVCGRLHRRLREHGLTRYGDYFQRFLADSAGPEAEIALNLLTTNETYFFREPKHFDFFRHKILPRVPLDHCFRVWSAACSTGEEPYSLAMVMAEARGDGFWEILASDINSSVLVKAAQACYPLERLKGIPEALVRKYCLRGVRSQEGTFIINRCLRERVRFLRVNLIEDLPALSEVDVVFLRNVLIYFDYETKVEVVNRLVKRLRPEGFFIVGHSEILHGMNESLTMIAPTVYQRKLS